MREGGNEWRVPATCFGRRQSVKLPVIHWGLRRKVPGGCTMPKPSQTQSLTAAGGLPGEARALRTAA